MLSLRNHDSSGEKDYEIKGIGNNYTVFQYPIYIGKEALPLLEKTNLMDDIEEYIKKPE